MGLASKPIGASLRIGIQKTLPIFVTAIVFSFFINLLMFVSPLYMLQIYDRVVNSRSFTTLIAITVLAGFLLLVYAALEALRSRILVRAGLMFDEEVAGPVFAAVHKGNIRVPNGGFGQCLRDVDVLREFLTGPGLIALCDAPWFPIFVAACFMLHPWFGFLALAGSIVTLGLTVLNEVVTKRELNAATVAAMDANQSAQAMFRNGEVLQAMGMLGAVRSIWQRQHDFVLSLQALASDRAGGIIAFTKFFRMFLQTLILGVGAYLVINREISPGAIIAGSILVGRALQPIEMAVGSWKGFLAARASFARLKHLLTMTGDDPVRISLPKPEGALDVADLIAAAPSNPNVAILKGVSFNLPAGELLGVVGPSAAGKSSLARVLVGVWPLVRGSVRLDGHDLAQWDPQELGPHIGYLPQDVELFAGSVAQNIARFRDADSEAVMEAAMLAGCHELIQHFPQGYNTQIGDGGQALSGGQRQRIGLARAIFGRPSLIVLDEPNANLDSAGEEALLAAVQRLKSMRTTIVIISHKLNILSAVDQILVMADGANKAYGPRDAVLQSLIQPRVVANSGSNVPTTTTAAAQGAE